MGSLVPGWNSTAPGVPPKELRDYDDHAAQQREGYFAKLTKTKSMKNDGLPVSDQNPEAGSPTAARSLQRASTLPTRASGRLSISISPSQQRGTGSPTPASPRTPRSPLTRKSAPLTGAELRKEEEAKKDPIHQPFKWWRKFSSARLNEMPDTADPNNWRRSPYVPQYAITGQKMQYIGTEVAKDNKAGDKKESDSPKAPETPPAVSSNNIAHRPASSFISVH